MQDDSKLKNEDSYDLGGCRVIYVILYLECFDVVYTLFFVRRVAGGPLVTARLIIALRAMSSMRSDMVSMRV